MNTDQVVSSRWSWCRFTAGRTVGDSGSALREPRGAVRPVRRHIHLHQGDADNSKPSKSHYYVKGDTINPDRPRDWTAPVDYRNGTVHIRTEVIEKPAGGEPTTWTLCYIPNQRQGERLRLHGHRPLPRKRRVRTRRLDEVSSGRTTPSSGRKASSRWTWSSRTTAAAAAMRTSGKTRRSSSRPRCGSPWSRCRPVRNTTRAWSPICLPPQVRTVQSQTARHLQGTGE